MIHCNNPIKYINRKNNPKNLATGSEKFAPKIKLNIFLIYLYKFSVGSNQVLHKDKLIDFKHEKWLKLWIKKFNEINVNAHLHIFVVKAIGFQSLYSFSSELISVQNQTVITIKKNDKFRTNKALSCLPIKSIKLIKNKIDICQ